MLSGGGLMIIGKDLSTSEGDSTIIFLDINSGREIRRFEGHSWIVNSVAFSPDGIFPILFYLIMQ